VIDPAWREFLLSGTKTGKVAVVRANGLAHVTPVWFLLDDDDTLVFNTGVATVKGRALARTGTFTMSVDDQTPPYSYAMLECQVRSLVDDDPASRMWATRLAARYMGADVAEQYGERNAVPGEYLVRAEITRFIGQHGVAS
jgi:PPOX class probable F420-dependent enzyme